ncbi:dihydrofolate reductase [Agaricicola taiwanensis]|uniref:Dihydrofolate reductase n=1 Tax=Agaricicola taiwanensis TaxID=591372 RepID=A0A8J2YM81_9RHOB|nr:2-hydroxyacid dehydrogenase [Agaricicola taiwanensis]GGE53443.1 dihydrofolate reductase [Agaricicola taiwanensis]
MLQPHLLLFSTIPQASIEALRRNFTVHEVYKAEDREALIRETAPEVEAVIGYGAGVRVDADLIDRLPKLKIISTVSVGYDAIDVVHAAQKGIAVTNTPDVLTEEVADLTVALLLATVRELPAADRYLREGKWLKGPYPFSRATMKGRKVGILGLGRIGKAVAARLQPFGVSIAYHGRRQQSDVPYRYYGDLVEMAREVDTLVSLAPGGAETKAICNRAVFEALGADGIFVNVGRGSTVDEPALIEALRDGVILSAGLDVFADEPRVPQALIDLPNTVLLPHVGSASVATRAAMAELAVANLIAWREGRPLLTPVVL